MRTLEVHSICHGEEGVIVFAWNGVQSDSAEKGDGVRIANFLNAVLSSGAEEACVREMAKNVGLVIADRSEA